MFTTCFVSEYTDGLLWPRVRAAAILILLFKKTEANRADWMPTGVTWKRYSPEVFQFFPFLPYSLFTLNAFYALCVLTITDTLLSVCVSLSLFISLPHILFCMDESFMNKINKNHDDLTNTAVMKLRSIRDRVCCGEILCRPAMDFSDKLISNAIKWTACRRIGIIYSRLKLIKFLLQKLPLGLFMACVLHFISFMWIPEEYWQCVNYCMLTIVYYMFQALIWKEVRLAQNRCNKTCVQKHTKET